MPLGIYVSMKSCLIFQEFFMFIIVLETKSRSQLLTFVFEVYFAADCEKLRS